MILVDTHAHLDFDQFDGDRAAVLQRAQAAGVGIIITIGTDVASSQAAVELAAQHEMVYATVGMHPHDARTLDGDALAELRALGQRPEVVGVGEIGLDFYRDRSPRDVQRRAFRAQLAWAATLGKPVVIHDRDAHDEIMAVLGDWARGLDGTPLAGRAGVLHT
ncbi:MAG: TatD family hydrolase, partial [Anaerolineae bacterium]